MSYLIVVAHPDDEVLGAGATLAKLSAKGIETNVCILSVNADARNYRPELEELDKNIEATRQVLGIKKIYKGNFPNIKLNTVSHLELVQFIEAAILDCGADVLITHDPSDLNNDHLQTSLACQAAARLFQRMPHIKPLKELMFMEVPSSTEWSLNTGGKFTPNLFIEVGEEYIDKKIEALKHYIGVMRDYPHPRSEAFIKAQAVYRGGQSGIAYAEAFNVVFRRIVE
ncbi:PIG-L family deacetylase [Niameybacter massiliensis]|uniref:PIG-L family deacetylase n=1 Tax=Holtiella tumoricola TaxID=3018743 RepID=A0AA42DM03_9FIRM|nr:PIG-L deacetylase family protein [Holtiella tumoricola]MDA3731277.1 PIG-L family deacetylase [Holtiella tumoricola]